MVAATIKHMASNFSKLDKFEGMDFSRWEKNMHFLLSIMSVVYVLTTPIPEDGGDDATVDQIRKRAKWNNDDYVCRGLILKDFKHTLKHKKEELTLVELGSHLHIEESHKVQDNDKPKGNNVAGSKLLYFCFNWFMTRVLPYPLIPQTLPAEFVSNLNEDDEIEISVNGKMLRCNVRRQEVIDHPGRHEFVLLGDTWDTLVKSLDLKIGSVCVFTKNRGKRLWFDAFDDDGHMVTNVVFKGDAILRRHQLQLTLLEEYDDLISKMFATGDRVQASVVIPIEILTMYIKKTEAYRDYFDKF
ncbi:zinc finger, CCHC-type containing protein [Tanacetum coccineum]|uniref:Zinc finger, CCHC-type containing protein n=1 Tax=Tanacetum coccineum TaxID=301880 RepID=A0ABQ5E573_9ASTR